ncbi:MAG TPA: hypothetical protein VHF47_02190 [Acidimicrobiales bacterium]|nr:hypothetical protein [Acidimicrobiales bacterium]
MKRERRRFAGSLATISLAAGLSWVPSEGHAHTCYVVKAKPIDLEDAACTGEAEAPPTTHSCSRVATTHAVAVACVEVP